MELSARIGIAAAIVVAAGAALLVAPLEVADAHSDAFPRPTLTERPACAAADAESDAWPATLGGSNQAVSVTVPRTALIRVDAAGAVRSAATNTGCAPRAGDDYYVIEPDGSVVPALAGDFAGQRWVGDFTGPGLYVAQDGSVANR